MASQYFRLYSVYLLFIYAICYILRQNRLCTGLTVAEPHLLVTSPSSFSRQVYFGTQHSRVYLVANWLAQNCANGMSWLLKKSYLEEVGGLAAFSDYLAEDFFIGKALWSRWKLFTGYSTSLCVCVCVCVCVSVCVCVCVCECVCVCAHMFSTSLCAGGSV